GAVEACTPGGAGLVRRRNSGIAVSLSFQGGLRVRRLEGASRGAATGGEHGHSEIPAELLEVDDGTEVVDVLLHQRHGSLACLYHARLGPVLDELNGDGELLPVNGADRHRVTGDDGHVAFPVCAVDADPAVLGDRRRLLPL